MFVDDSLVGQSARGKRTRRGRPYLFLYLVFCRPFSIPLSLLRVCVRVQGFLTRYFLEYLQYGEQHCLVRTATKTIQLEAVFVDTCLAAKLGKCTTSTETSLWGHR